MTGDPTLRRVTEERADPRRFLKDGAWLGLLAALEAVFFGPILFGGRTFFHAARLLTDLGLLREAAGRYAAGDWPLWTPNVFFGFPLLADIQEAALSLPNLLAAHWLRLDLALDALLLFYFFLLGAFAYLLLRAWGLHRATAAAGAALLQYSPFLLSPHNELRAMATVAFAPGVLWAVERGYQSGRRAWGALAALLGAMHFFGGQVQMSVYLGLLALPYALVRWTELRREPGGSRRWLWASGLAAFGALGLFAAQLLPAAELLRESPRLALTPEFREGPTVDRLTWTHLAEMLVPFHRSGVYTEGLRHLHVGMVPALLALAAWRSPRRRLARFWLVASLAFLSLGFGEGSPLYQALHALGIPGLSIFHKVPYRVMWPFSFALAMAGALGLEAVREREWDPSPKALIVIAVLALAAMLALSVPAMLDARGVSPGGALPERFGAFDRDLVAAGRLPRLVLGDNLLALAFLLAAAGATLALPRGRMRGGRYGAAMLAVLFLSRMLPAHLWLGEIAPPKRAEERPDRAWAGVAAFLGAQPGLWRVASPVFNENQAAALGFQEATGDSSMVRGAYLRWLAGGADLGWFWWEDGEVYRERFAALLADDARLAQGQVRFVVTGPELGGGEPVEFPDVLTPPRFTRLWSDGTYSVHEYAGAPPRASFEGGEARIVSYGANEVAFDVSAPEGGRLVLRDAYGPGWRAAADGEPIPIAPAFELFRAARVPPHAARVLFTYDPLSFRLGFFVALTTLLVVLVALVAEAHPRRLDAPGGAP